MVLGVSDNTETDDDDEVRVAASDFDFCARARAVRAGRALHQPPPAPAYRTVPARGERKRHLADGRQVRG